MTRITLAVFAMFSIIFASTIMAHSVYAQAAVDVANPSGPGNGAIPDWVKTQFEWFVDGQIDEATLLTSMNWMFDNNLMHLSEEAAQEVNQLREVSTRLHQGVNTYIQNGQISEEEFELLSGVDVEPTGAIAIPNLLDARKSGNESTQAGFTGGVRVATGDVNGDGTADAMNHLRKAYDLNPNGISVIAEFDPEHEEWVLIEAFEWNSETTEDGEILSPTAIQKRTFVFPHLLENSAATSSGEPTATITYTGLEFAGTTIKDVIAKGGTTSQWEDAIESFPKQDNVDSVVDELQGIVVLCSTEIDKESQRIDAELDIIEKWLAIIQEQDQETSTAGSATGDTSTTQNNQSDLEFIRQKLLSMDSEINSLLNGVDVLSQKVQEIDEPDSATQSGDVILKGKKILQNLVEEQEQKLDDMSERTKRAHDVAMNSIRNFK